MKTAIIGCGTIRNDLEKITENLPYEADIFWLDENLHNDPKLLNKVLQDKINELKEYDRIVLTFLLCGNALIGIKSETSVIYFLKGDDCIFADLCLRSDYKEVRNRSFFLSHAWLSGSRNPIAEYERSIERYGEKRAKRIYDAMYKNYTNAVYMNFGEEVPEEDSERLEFFANLAGLDIKYLEGNLELFRKLLHFEESEYIYMLKPGEEVEAKLFYK